MPRLNQAQWRQLQELAGMPGESDVGRVFAAAIERLRRPRFDPRRRDQVIAAAVAARKFSVDRVGFYASLWDSDPQGAERLIGSLAAVPAPAAGASSSSHRSPDPHELGEFAHLWPPGSRREQAARWRWQGQDSQAGELSDGEYEALFGPDK